MLVWNSNERVQTRNSIFPRACCLIGKAVALMALFAFLVGSNLGFGGETSLTEYQVKSLFLLNFLKYVDWPPVSFGETNMPIIIGLYGEDKFGDALKKAVEGKTVSGRRIIIQPIETDNDLGKCHILFISDSEKKHLGEILAKIKTLPVLTVGETDQFLAMEGMINFTKKENKIHLEINLVPAQRVNLKLSSKLLTVADTVLGKTEGNKTEGKKD